MTTTSFSFSIDEKAWKAWKNTINDRDKNLEDALREDIALVTLQRADGDLPEDRRRACEGLIENMEVPR